MKILVLDTWVLVLVLTCTWRFEVLDLLVLGVLISSKVLVLTCTWCFEILDLLVLGVLNQVKYLYLLVLGVLSTWPNPVDYKNIHTHNLKGFSIKMMQYITGYLSDLISQNIYWEIKITIFPYL